MLQGSVLEMLSHRNIWGNILNSDYHERLTAVVAACTCLKIIDSQGRKKWPIGSIVVSWNTFSGYAFLG